MRKRLLHTTSDLTSAISRRCRLLDAARGLAVESSDTSTTTTQQHRRTRPRHPLPSFPLQARHIKNNMLSSSPSEFHSTLCEMIRNAKSRVSLASLYIGPAAAPAYTKELEFLQTLSEIPPSVDVQIIMDSNRGLRQIPMKKSPDEDSNRTSSAAEAVAEAIHLRSNHQLFLCQVLPSPMDTVLPNPLNEVAGVFHIKAYIVDDELILSGANLSEEYFVDRHDRYFMISEGGNGLVDFYANLIDLLCQDYATPFHEARNQTVTSRLKKKPLQTFLKNLTKLFSDETDTSAESLLLDDPETVAVCVPTFHHPQESLLEAESNSTIPSDIQVTLDVLNEASVAKSDATTSVQLSSAYLNPTESLAEALQRFDHVELLTAGRESHGFKPKKTAGNKGKVWIPTVFDHLQLEAMQRVNEKEESRKKKSTTLLHWEKPGWTFHAKGLWLRQAVGNQAEDGASAEELLAAVVGSSNFGRRSFERDVESNLLIVFPPRGSGKENPLELVLKEEWDKLKRNTGPTDPQQVIDTAPPLPVYIRSIFPYIKSFF